MDQMESRVRRIERTNRALVVVLAVGVLFGMSTGSSPQHQDPEVATVLRARRIELVDEAGRVVLELRGNGSGSIEALGEVDTLGRKSRLMITPSSLVMTSRFGDEVIKLMHIDDRAADSAPPLRGEFFVMVHEGTSSLAMRGSEPTPSNLVASARISCGVAPDIAGSSLQFDASGPSGSSVSTIQVNPASVGIAGISMGTLGAPPRRTWSAGANRERVALHLQDDEKSRLFLIDK